MKSFLFLFRFRFFWKLIVLVSVFIKRKGIIFVFIFVFVAKIGLHTTGDELVQFIQANHLSWLMLLYFLLSPIIFFVIINDLISAVFTVWHLGTSLTISLLPLTSLYDFVCVPQTDISLLYLAVDSIHTAVGRFQLQVRRSGIRCWANWEIQRAVLTVLNGFSRQSFLVSTNVTSALEVI